MKFRRAVQRYGRTPEAVTPYHKASQLWDERIGSARAQARNWRIMALGGLCLSAGLSGGLVWQSSESRVQPYVVAVDRLGEARAVEPADRDYQPTDPEIAWFLARFIADVRSIPLDPVVMRRNWLSAYDFATGAGARFLDHYARSSSPFAEVGTRTVSVQVRSVLRASARSFEVKWTESAYERGNPSGSTHWTAILSFIRRPPSSPEELRRNPLGLYVDSIDWSEDLEVAEADSAAAKPPFAVQPLGSAPRSSPAAAPAEPAPSTRSIQ